MSKNTQVAWSVEIPETLVSEIDEIAEVWEVPWELAVHYILKNGIYLVAANQRLEKARKKRQQRKNIQALKDRFRKGEKVS